MKPLVDFHQGIPAGPVKSPAGNTHLRLRRAFDVCVQKTQKNIKDLADHPAAWSNAIDGDYSKWKEGFFEIGNWTSSFFTGMALISWQQTKEEYFLKQVLRLASAYREKACVRYLDMHHDAGFLYNLYSIALYKLTGDEAHREVGIAAAKALAQRFNEKGNFIRAWGQLNTVEHENMAIIDCLMNLPLLYWAFKETGDKKFYRVAVNHADMALKYFVRPDDTVCHAYRFNPRTGHPIGPDNYCGYSIDSYWSRGATWAVYGFALCHHYTGDKKYLDVAVSLAKKFITELDAEVVPAWDFRLPSTAESIRDASAAAVMVCAIQELAKAHAANQDMVSIKNLLLERICSDDYLDSNPTCRGVLKSAYGNKVAYSSWGDYFLMEAIANELYRRETFW